MIGAGNLMGGALPIGQMVQKQLGQTGIPVYNVSNACATGATALRVAVMAIKAGETDMGLAFGVEKLAGAGLLAGGSRKATTTHGRRRAATGRWPRIDGRIGTETCRACSPRSAWSTATATAAPASSCSPRSARRTTPTRRSTRWRPTRRRCRSSEIMNDVMIAYPNTRPMCSANCDGAAAAVVVSGSKLKTLSLEQQRRAVKISASILTTDPWEEACQVLPNVNHADPQRCRPGLRAGRRRARRTSTWWSCTTASPPPSWCTTTTSGCASTAARSTSSSRARRGVTARRRSTSRAAWSPRATRSPPPASPTCGRWPPTSAARPATARSRAPRWVSPMSSGSGSACGVHILEKSAA